MTDSTHTSSGYSVRSMTHHDMPAVHQLVKELAAFERLPREVVTTPAIYEQDFGSGWFEGLVAVDAQDRVVGAMIFHRAYSTWKGRMIYLEDFIVAQQVRRRGIGEQLWAALTAHARACSCTSIKWQVLDWNDTAKAFYAKSGAELEGGWENGRLWL